MSAIDVIYEVGASRMLLPPGTAETVHALIERGAGINARTEDGETTLHRAAGVGNRRIMRVLINAGAYCPPC